MGWGRGAVVLRRGGSAKPADDDFVPPSPDNTQHIIASERYLDVEGGIHRASMSAEWGNGGWWRSNGAASNTGLGIRLDCLLMMRESKGGRGGGRGGLMMAGVRRGGFRVNEEEI
jgi:hypothetical protein